MNLDLDVIVIITGDAHVRFPTSGSLISHRGVYIYITDCECRTRVSIVSDQCPVIRKISREYFHHDELSVLRECCTIIDGDYPPEHDLLLYSTCTRSTSVDKIIYSYCRWFWRCLRPRRLLRRTPGVENKLHTSVPSDKWPSVSIIR